MSQLCTTGRAWTVLFSCHLWEIILGEGNVRENARGLCGEFMGGMFEDSGGFVVRDLPKDMSEA